MWFRRKTLPQLLAERIPEPTDGDLTLDLAVWCGREDAEAALARVDYGSGQAGQRLQVEPLTIEPNRAGVVHL